MAVVAVLAYLVAASPLAGPEGLIPGTATQFAVKTAMGSLVAFALVAPLVLDRRRHAAPAAGHHRHGHPGPWSYGLFIWHLAALAMVFPVIGTFPFTGRMPTVLVLTLIFGFAIAAVSYALVESPCPGSVAALGETREAGRNAEPGRCRGGRDRAVIAMVRAIQLLLSASADGRQMACSIFSIRSAPYSTVDPTEVCPAPPGCRRQQ